MLATLSSLSRSALLAILGALPPVDFPAVGLGVVLLALAEGTACVQLPLPLLNNAVGGSRN